MKRVPSGPSLFFVLLALLILAISHYARAATPKPTDKPAVTAKVTFTAPLTASITVNWPKNPKTEGIPATTDYHLYEVVGTKLVRVNKPVGPDVLSFQILNYDAKISHTYCVAAFNGVEGPVGPRTTVPPIKGEFTVTYP